MGLRSLAGLMSLVMGLLSRFSCQTLVRRIVPVHGQLALGLQVVRREHIQIGFQRVRGVQLTCQL